MNHITKDHSDSLDKAKTAFKNPVAPFCSKKDKNLFGCVYLIVNDLLPFSFCERKFAQKYNRLTSVFVEILMVEMNRLMIKRKARPRQIFPNVFALMFDSCDSLSTYYLEVIRREKYRRQVNR